MCSTNPIAQLASSNHHFPPSNFFFDDEKDGLYSPCPATENFPTSKQHSVGVEGLGLEKSDEQKHVMVSEVSPRKRKKTSKKDYRSKIHTAQGPRDRRVRLSIDVARKFFYLQDLLGFEKPSKTLDWMFKMSDIPIDELVEAIKQSSSSTVTDEQKKKTAAPSCPEGQGKKKIRKRKSEGVVNQSRAEARARARERTKQKLQIKKLQDPLKLNKVDDEFCCRENPSYLKPQSCFWRQQKDFEDKIGESVMDEKMLMSSSMLYSYQHNLPMSNRSNIPDFPKFTLLHDQQAWPLENFERKAFEDDRVQVMATQHPPTNI